MVRQVRLTCRHGSSRIAALVGVWREHGLGGFKYRPAHCSDETMRMLGSVRLASSKRITVSDALVDALRIGEGDFILFYEDKGTVIVKGQKG
jgi:hypothetical protein